MFLTLQLIALKSKGSPIDQTAATDFMLNYLSNKLHNLSQVLLLLQDLLGLGTQGHKFREVLVVILIQSPSVFAVADQPVHRREVLPLSQLLIQTPEHLREESMVTYLLTASLINKTDLLT